MPDSVSKRTEIAVFGDKTVCISYAKHISMRRFGKPKIIPSYSAYAKARS
jgi:hypothetical protein